MVEIDARTSILTFQRRTQRLCSDACPSRDECDIQWYKWLGVHIDGCLMKTLEDIKTVRWRRRSRGMMTRKWTFRLPKKKRKNLHVVSKSTIQCARRSVPLAL